MALALLAGLLAACTGGSSTQGRPLPNGPYSTRPNIVFVLTDDLSDNLIRYMPNVVALEHAGVRFSNYTVTDSLCCPSRASILTGRFPHNTRIFTNDLPDGGYGLFHQRGEDKQTFAPPLHNAGYRTAFMGKYLNGFRVPTDATPSRTRDSHVVPPGWSTWAGAGFAYGEYGYDLDENGTLHHYGTRPQDYLTDVIGKLGQKFIRQSARARAPFFLQLSTFAPHSPATPAAQDVGSFRLHVPRTASFDRHPTNSPRWLASIPPFHGRDYTRMNKSYTKRVEAVQAVDRVLGELEDTLKRTGQLGNTMIVFSSDNGYHIGEHGLLGGKLTAFDTDVRVPLVVAGPGIARNTVNSDVVENVDLAPTFEQLAGAATPATVDGRSFVPLLQGEHPAWRTLATVEHHGEPFDLTDPDRQNRFHGTPPSYNAMRSPTFTYVRYDNGQREYYDRVTDPLELHNVAASLTPSRLAELDMRLDRLITCRGQAQCWAAAEPSTS